MKSENANPVQALKAHLAINVENVGRSIEFYKKMLGIEPAKVRTSYAKFDVENPPLNLTLNERPGVARGAISHLGIQVASTEDVLATRERWRKAGLSTFDEEQTNCCFAVQDKTWVTDPDGNEWEAFVVLQDNLPETQSGFCCTTNEAEKLDAAGAVAEAQAAGSCGCEAAPPPPGQAPCCGTQAAKFGITH